MSHDRSPQRALEHASAVTRKGLCAWRCRRLRATHPEILPRGPELVGRGPELLRTGPELVGRGPELTARGLEISRKGLKLIRRGLELQLMPHRTP
jgi:hypothetical protein